MLGMGVKSSGNRVMPSVTRTSRPTQQKPAQQMSSEYTGDDGMVHRRSAYDMSGKQVKLSSVVGPGTYAGGSRVESVQMDDPRLNRDMVSRITNKFKQGGQRWHP